MSYSPPKISYCRECLNALDAATGIEKGTLPSPGDFSVCFYSGPPGGGTLSVYDEQLVLRRPTVEEMGEVIMQAEEWEKVLKLKRIIKARQEKTTKRYPNE